MAMLILLTFIGLPLLEIFVFFEVGGAFGLGVALILTLMTGLAGIFLIRAQGLSTVFRVREALNRGEVPIHAVFDGACQLIAGVFLVVPGFITDSLGLLLFAPALRRFLMAWLTQSAHVTFVVPPGGETGKDSYRTYDLDGDCKDVTPSEGPFLSSAQPPKTD